MFKLGIMQGRLYPDNLINYNLFPKKWTKEFSDLKKIGFNYIELIYDKKLNKINPLINGKINTNYFKKLTKNKMYSINLDYFTKNNIFKNFSKNKNILKKVLNFSNKLKIKIVVIPCIEKNFLSNDKLVKLIILLKKLTKNKYCNISLETENFNIKLLENLNQKIGICYDTGNLAISSKYYLKNLEKNLKYINHIHLKDKKLNSGLSCRLGKGYVNFKKIFFILKKKKYKGAVTFETSLGKNSFFEAKQNFDFVKSFL